MSLRERIARLLPMPLRNIKSRREAPKEANAVIPNQPYRFPDHVYPVFPPPPPKDLLENAQEYWEMVEARLFDAPRGCSADAPLYALYRLYEAFVLDRRFAYRNLLEYFWRKPTWKLHEIPDPTDDDHARYAFIAGVVYLMLKSFNERVALGLVRGASPLMSSEEREEAKKIPQEQRPWERLPQWAEDVPPLGDTLVIPTDGGVILTSKEDKRADPDFLNKNILLWTPHIYFT